MVQLPLIDGQYRTPPQRVSWFARLFPSLAFHFRFAGIIWRCYRKAKRGEYDSQAWSASSLEVLRALEKSGVQFEITGIDHVRALDSACLIVSNHMSTLETLILPGLIQPIREVTFVVKEPLLEYPVFKHIMRSRDPVAVSQTDPRGDFKKVMKGGLERLKRGISIIIFPQGIRAATFDPQRFNSIGVKLASRADLPIVPLALVTDAWKLGRIFTDFGRIVPAKIVRFAFAPPVQVQGRGANEQAAIIEFIHSKLEEWDAPRVDGVGEPQRDSKQTA